MVTLTASAQFNEQHPPEFNIEWYRSSTGSLLPEHLRETLGSRRGLKEIMSTDDYCKYMDSRESYDNLNEEYQDSTAIEYLEDFGLAYRSPSWFTRDQSLKGEFADMDLKANDIVWDLGCGGGGAIQELTSGTYDIDGIVEKTVEPESGEEKIAEIKGFAFSNLKWLGLNAVDRRTDTTKLDQGVVYKTGVIEDLQYRGAGTWVDESIAENLVPPKVILLRNSLMYGAEEELSGRYPDLAGLTEGRLRIMVDILAPGGKILIYETSRGTKRGAKGGIYARAVEAGMLQVQCGVDFTKNPELLPQLDFDTYDYYEVILRQLQQDGINISFEYSHGPNADRTGPHFVITKN